MNTNCYQFCEQRPWWLAYERECFRSTNMKYLKLRRNH